MKNQDAGRMSKSGLHIKLLQLLGFEFDLRCEASVSQFLNRGKERGGTELPAESYFS